MKRSIYFEVYLVGEFDPQRYRIPQKNLPHTLAECILGWHDELSEEQDCR